MPDAYMLVQAAKHIRYIGPAIKSLPFLGKIDDVGAIVRGQLDETLKLFRKLTSDEKRVVETLLDEGKNVKLMPETPNAGRAFDFFVDDIPTELKTLNNANINTLLSTVKKALRQLDGDGLIIYDISKANFTDKQMIEIYERLKGLYGNDIISKIRFIK